MFLVVLTNFGKDLTHKKKIKKKKKTAIKNAYLGSIFIPEKCVFRVCFESTLQGWYLAWNTSGPKAISLYKALLVELIIEGLII